MARLASPDRPALSAPSFGRVAGSAAAVGLALVAAVAAAVAVAHPVGLVIVAATLVVGLLLLVGRAVPDLFLGALAVLLIGYAFLGKGFAYIGLESLYVGEAVLTLGLVALLMSLRRVRVGLFEIVLIAFVLWGAIRTIPYVPTYGLESLRDAASWGYALFAVAVAACLRPRHLEPLVNLYRRMSVPLVLWLPLAAILTISFGDRLPTAPGSDVPIVSFKAGDAGVQLAGIASFALVGLAGRSPDWRGWRETLMWAGWLLSAGLSSALNRGAMVSLATAGLAMLFVRRANSWLLALAVGILLLSAAWILNPEVDIGTERKLSIQQFVQNAVSIVSSTGDANEGTKAWRLAWWDTIIDYTIDGPYFWTGKGYGVNLADDDGFQVLADGSLRAPHSANFEFLARSGVPGLGLWIALLVAFAVTILRAARAAAVSGQRYHLALLGWAFVYWIAAFINMSVDVYLGGPQGGIWFWAMIGVGLAVSRFVWDEKRARESVGQEAGPTSDDRDEEARDHRGVATP